MCVDNDDRLAREKKNVVKQKKEEEKSEKSWYLFYGFVGNLPTMHRKPHIVGWWWWYTETSYWILWFYKRMMYIVHMIPLKDQNEPTHIVFPIQWNSNSFHCGIILCEVIFCSTYDICIWCGVSVYKMCVDCRLIIWQKCPRSNIQLYRKFCWLSIRSCTMNSCCNSIPSPTFFIDQKARQYNITYQPKFMNTAIHKTPTNTHPM